jgi:hypothetical protein
MMLMLREGTGSRAEQLVKGGVSGGKKVMLQIFKGASSLASTAYAAALGAPASAAASGVSSSAHDLAFGELEAYYEAQAPLVAALYSAAAVLSNRYRDQAQTLLAHGAALKKLGELEGGRLGDSLSRVGLAAWAASTVAYEQAVCQTEAFVEKLADAVRMARSVRDATAERRRASAQLGALSNEVDRLRALITALTNSPAPHAARDRALAEADMAAASRLATEARVYYDKVAQAYLAEAGRYRDALTTDARTMLLDFSTIQLRTEEKLAAAWEITAQHLGGAPRAQQAIMN